MRVKIYTVVISLLFAVSVSGARTKQRPQKPDPCPNALTQPDIDRCAMEQFKKADKDLNVVYQRITSNLNAIDRANLTSTQRAWLKYRDANCKAERQFHGGSMAPTVEAFCLQRLTEDRTQDLIRIYETVE